MKTPNTPNLLLLSGFVVISALALPGALAASPLAGVTAASLAAADESQTVVAGRVDAKSDKSLSVDGQTVLITDMTTFTKDGAPATLADVNTGDAVRVTASKGAAGSLVAVRVEVTSAAGRD
jgi:hypothetical protein